MRKTATWLTDSHHSAMDLLSMSSAKTNFLILFLLENDYLKKNNQIQHSFISSAAKLLLSWSHLCYRLRLRRAAVANKHTKNRIKENAAWLWTMILERVKSQWRLTFANVLTTWSHCLIWTFFPAGGAVFFASCLSHCPAASWLGANRWLNYKYWNGNKCFVQSAQRKHIRDTFNENISQRVRN